MKLVNWKQLFEKSIGSEEVMNWIEEEDDIAYMAGEAGATKGLDYFHITVTERGLGIPEGLNTEEAIQIVSDYLALVEEEGTDNPLAYKYDEATKPYRGADDGTYDYAGSFVILILLVIENYLK